MYHLFSFDLYLTAWRPALGGGGVQVKYGPLLHRGLRPPLYNVKLRSRTNRLVFVLEKHYVTCAKGNHYLDLTSQRFTLSQRLPEGRAGTA
jgi:hypothetical protein